MLALTLLEWTCQFALRSWLLSDKLKRWVMRKRALWRAARRLGVSLKHLVFQHRLWGSWELELIVSAQPLRMITRCISRGKTFVRALGSCYSSKSQSWQKMAYDSQLVRVTRKVTCAQQVDILCVGWGSVLRLPACQLKCGTMQAGERGIDSPIAWKSICSDVSHLALGIPVTCSTPQTATSFSLLRCV